MYTFLNGISPKINVLIWLQFERADFKAVVKYHYIVEILALILGLVN